MTTYRHLGPFACAALSEAQWQALPPSLYMIAGNLDSDYNDLQVMMPGTGRSNIAVFQGTRHDGDIMTWREGLGLWVPCGSIDIPGTVAANKVSVLQNSTNALEVRRVDNFDATTSKTGTGTGNMETFGDHTHAADVSYVVTIDTAGDENTATFKWSNDAGVTWDAELVPVSAVSRTYLQNDYYVLFTEGTYVAADTWAWTAIGTASQLYDLKVDTTNSIVKVGNRLEMANDPNFALANVVTTWTGPGLIFDSGDYIVYKRSTNQLDFTIGGFANVYLNANVFAVGLPLSLGDCIDLFGIATPATPTGLAGRFYAKSVGGIIRAHWLDSAATESVLAFTSELHSAVTLAAGGQHTLSGQEITSVAATASQAGHATAAQITKLDGIATGADVTGSNAPQAHGPSKHTEGTAWRLTYQNTAGDETELALGADGTVLTSTGAAAAPTMEAIYVSHTLVFTPDYTSLTADSLNPRGICVGEAGEHGTFTAFRAKAIASVAGAGTNTILIEADDNPAFASATTLFTLPLNTATEVDDTSLDAAWAAGDIFVRARCSAVNATAPTNVVVTFYYKERAEAF